MKRNPVYGYIYDEKNGPLLSSDLLALGEELLTLFPGLNLSPSYWDVSFEYYYIDDLKEKIDVHVILSNKDRKVSLSPPDEMCVDYFVNEDTLLPIRNYDFEILCKFLPTLDHDGVPGMTIRELMNFDYFASSNNFLIDNSELKDRLLSSSKIDVTDFKNNLSVEPYPYQAVGIEWLITQQLLRRDGVILGDMMGLGKTLQAIGLITYNVDEGMSDNLIICPGTLIENWQREILKFSPSLKVHVHFGKLRAGTASKIKGFDIVLTSYDVLIQDHAMLSTVNWNLVIIDEAQAIKNPHAQRTIRAKLLPRKFGVAITGTPLENKLMDLWSIADFASPGLFGSETEFQNEFEDAENGATEVNKILRPILLRRKLDEIDHQLPEKIVIDHPLAWPIELNQIYEQTRQEALAEFSSAGGLVATGRLRKLTTHPSLMGIDSLDLAELSPKYSLLLDIVSELFANDEKCLIFSSYKRMIDLLAHDLYQRFPNSFIKPLDGRTEMNERSPLVDTFNLHGGRGALICNPIVAGAGLNITGANHVIHYNLEWNPAKEDQATFRVYRNGQSKATFIHRLFYVDTIDEVIDRRIQAKRALSDLSVDATSVNDDYFAGLQISPLGNNGA
jgi:SNF2 family DNA or RNA helicase